MAAPAASLDDRLHECIHKALSDQNPCSEPGASLVGCHGFVTEACEFTRFDTDCLGIENHDAPYLAGYSGLSGVIRERLETFED